MRLINNSYFLNMGKHSKDPNKYEYFTVSNVLILAGSAGGAVLAHSLISGLNLPGFATVLIPVAAMGVTAALLCWLRSLVRMNRTPEKR